MSLDFGVIADDLTGGLIVAGMLEREGVACPLVTEADQAALVGDCSALVIARRFRLSPPAAAVADVEVTTRALNGLGAKQVYYKYCATFDSTDDGNIGPCADAIMRLRGVDRLGFCPAFPAVDVTVYQGHMFYKGALLSESAKRFDPVTPMPDSNLVRVLQRQTRHKIDLVPRRIVHRGVAAVSSFVEDRVAAGIRYFIFDAIDDEDVRICAGATADWPAMTGGDTLAQLAPAVHGMKKRTIAQKLPKTGGHEAILAGSCGAATLEQLSRFAAHHPVRTIDLVDAAPDPERAIADAVDWADDRKDKGPFAIATSAPPDLVERAHAALGREAAGHLGERLFSGLAKRLYDLGVRNFIVAGGETSGIVVEALDIKRVDVAPMGDFGGGLCHAAAPDPMSLLLKAGKMGGPDVFLCAFEEMRNFDG